MIEHHLIRSPSKYGWQAHNTLVTVQCKYHFGRKGMKVMRMSVEPINADPDPEGVVETALHVEIYKKPRIIK